MKTRIIAYSLWIVLLSSFVLGWTFSVPSLRDYDFLSIAVGGTNQLPPIMVTGNLHLESYRPIYPNASGVITQIHVKPGDRVRKGQVLVELDYEKRDLALYVKLKRMANQLGINEIVGQYLTTLKATKSQGVSRDFRTSGLEEQFLTTVRDYVGLLKNLTDLKEQTEDRILFAPFSGIISEVNVVIGERVDPQRDKSPVLGLLEGEDPSLQIKLELPEEVVSMVSLGDKVTAQVPLTEITEVPAKITSIASSITQTDVSRFYSATAAVERQFNRSQIRQGMKVFANITNSKLPDGIWIPRSAIDLEIPQFMISQTLNLTNLDSNPKEFSSGKTVPERKSTSGQSPVTTQLSTRAISSDIRTANIFLYTTDQKIVKAVVPVGVVSEEQVLVLSKAIDGAQVITHFSKKKKNMFTELSG